MRDKNKIAVAFAVRDLAQDAVDWQNSLDDIQAIWHLIQTNPDFFTLRDGTAVVGGTNRLHAARMKLEELVAEWQSLAFKR